MRNRLPVCKPQGHVSLATVASGIPAPRAQKESKWFSRLATLKDFANRASEKYDYNPTSGTPDYLVLRKETAPVFAARNDWLGTNLRLP